MMSRAWTCALILAACAAGAWADDKGDNRGGNNPVIVIQKKDIKEIERHSAEISREVADELRAALEEARRDMRDSRREMRNEHRESFRVELDDEHREELRETLRDIIGESRGRLHEAGDTVHELMAQGITGWHSRGAAFLGPEFTLGDSGAGNARTVDERKSAAGVDRIEIHNVAGRVTVQGSDQNEIHVKGSLGEDVEELIFEVDGSSAEVRVKIPSGRRNLKIRSELTITVPKELRVEAETVSGGVEAMDIDGEYLRLETVSGGVNVARCTGDIEVSTTSGGINIADARKSVRAECVSGGIDIGGTPESVSAESVSGSVRITGVQRAVESNSVSGRVTVSGGMLERLDSESVSGGMDYVGGIAPGGRFDISSVSGGVSLTFVGHVSAEFDLQSFSGGITIDLPGAPTSAKRQISFRTGDGRGRVDVESFSGGIRINQK